MKRIMRDRAVTERDALLIGFATLALSHASSTLAQSVTAPAEQSAGPQLEEVLVTAQRREESAQDVPVSLTAVSAAMIEAAGVQTLEDLTRGIVGIQYDSGSTQRNELYIRGIGTNRFDIGADPSSGVYIDEIYQPRFADVLTGLLDVERVEVLRGPQGTLFGRNTIGGAVSVFTANPDDSFNGKAAATVGSEQLVDFAGTLSGPISDRTSARLTASYRNRDGFMRDTVSGRTDAVESIATRGKLHFNLGTGLTLGISGAYFESTQDAMLGNPESLPLFIGGPLTAQVLDGDKYRGAYNIPGSNEIENAQLAARLTWQTSAADVVLLGSYISFDQSTAQDLDGSFNDNINYWGHSESDSYSLELRFASVTDGALTFGDRLRWVGGIFYFGDDGTEQTDLQWGPDSLPAFVFDNPTLSPPFTAPSSRSTDRMFVASEVSSVAVYAQGTFDLTDRLALTGGARWTRDERDFSFRGDSSIPGFVFVPADFIVHGNPTSESFDPKVSLELRPLQDVLLYVSYSQGYKTGSIQSTAFDATIASRTTQPEQVEAVEVGIKSDLFERRVRVNLAAFQNDFEDLQVRRVVTFPSGFSSAISENAASSTIRGVELETSWLLSSSWRLNASYAYLDANYETYVVDAAAGIIFSGNRLPRAPEHRFNVDATYTIAFSGGSTLDLRGAYNWTGEFFFQPSNSAIEREAAYGLTDVSATFAFANRNTTLQLWGRNVLDEEYRTYLDPLDRERVAIYGDRRTYGITLSQSF